MYWRVSPRIWNKPWSDDARLLALYLLTNQHRELEGLYRLPKAYMCSDLGWDAKRLDKPFAELLRERFIAYHEPTQTVLIRKALKYQHPENPNQTKHALRAVEALPDTPLLVGLWAAAHVYFKPFAKGLRERFPKPFAKPFGEGLREGFGKPPSPTPSPSPSPKGKRRGVAFAPPTVAEVGQYISSKGYAIDPEAFVAHYSSNGWKVGGNPMVDWKAAVTTWHRNRGRYADRGSAHSSVGRSSAPAAPAPEPDPTETAEDRERVEMYAKVKTGEWTLRDYHRWTEDRFGGGAA